MEVVDVILLVVAVFVQTVETRSKWSDVIIKCDRFHHPLQW